MNPVLRFEGFELDRRAGELRRDGVRIRIQEKPLQLLELLLDHPGEVVTRDELRHRLWPADTFVDFEGGLNTAVKKVRTALGDSAESPSLVETVGRRGYRFIGRVEGLAAAMAPAGTVKRAPPPVHRVSLGALATGAVLLVLATVWGVRASRTASPSPIRSLAVLPLHDLSGDPAQVYFADGITEAIITDLASIRSLRVVSRQSVLAYRDSRKSLPQIARELGVDGLVQGSVQREGGRVRVSAQLLLGSSDRHLWARTYERDLGDALRLQAELARTIANEVRARLTPAEEQRLADAPAVRPEAYDAYLRARYFWNRREGAKAVEYFERAIAADPSFSRAYAGLAETFGPFTYGGQLATPEARRRMQQAAARAVELDPNSAEAHNALAAWLWYYEWEWDAADAEFRRALELNPGYAAAHAWYAFLLRCLGREADALREAELALESDPVALNTAAMAAWVLDTLGRSDRAIAQYRNMLELDPRYRVARLGLARVYIDKGRREEARAELREVEAQAGDHLPTRITIGHMAVYLGRPEEARRLLEELLRLSKTKTRYVSPVDVAVLYSQLGDRDRAFEWLERAYAERTPMLTRIGVFRAFQPLRGDPRYRDLLRRMNLPA